MRIFKDPYEAIKEVERDLMEMGLRVFSATVQDRVILDTDEAENIELTGYAYSVTLTGSNTELQKNLNLALAHRGTPSGWFIKDMGERLSSDYVNPGTAYKAWESLWGKYIHKETGRFAYTYNERIRDQLPIIIQELKTRPSTRQAIITIYDKHQDLGGLGGRYRVPCSLGYQFLIRNGFLCGIYYQRSCDMVKHFAADMVHGITLQKYIADRIDKEVGMFTHFIGSLHAFKKDLEKWGIF